MLAVNVCKSFKPPVPGAKEVHFFMTQKLRIFGHKSILPTLALDAETHALRLYRQCTADFLVACKSQINFVVQIRKVREPNSLYQTIIFPLVARYRPPIQIEAALRGVHNRWEPG